MTNVQNKLPQTVTNLRQFRIINIINKKHGKKRNYRSDKNLD